MTSDLILCFIIPSFFAKTETRVRERESERERKRERGRALTRVWGENTHRLGPRQGDARWREGAHGAYGGRKWGEMKMGLAG
jgi:hypothetical protein